MILNIAPIEPGDAASPNLWNSRFAAISEVMNGNVDSDNLKNGAVTREKIAAASVSSDKLDIDKYIDERGWTVTDYGTTKDYSIRKTGTISVVHGNWTRISQDFPVGITSINDVTINMALHSDWTELIFTIVPAAGNDKIYINVFNTHPTLNATNISYKIDFLVKRF